MADDWDAAFADEQDLSQKEVDDIESACDCRSESCSEHSSESAKFTSWWSRVLFRAVSAMGIQWPACPSRPVQVASACTGCSAEASVLKAGCMVGGWRYQLSVSIPVVPQKAVVEVSKIGNL